MSKEQTNTTGGVFRAGLGLLGAIMLASFGVSFMHVRELFIDNGADIVSATSLASVVELLFTGSSLEILRRHRMGEEIWPPVLTLLLGVGMTLWGNLATARHATGAMLAAGFAPLATILTVIVIKTAWTAATDRKAAAERERAAAEEAAARREAVRSARVARQDTGQDSRPDSGTGHRTPAQDPQTAPGIVGGPVNNVEQPGSRPRLELVGGSRKTQLPAAVLDDLLSATPTRKQKDVAEEYGTTERTIRRIVADAREMRGTDTLSATGESSG